MPRPRRTEHCWPVAHTLDDLLPLIPDPASLEVGSVLRIERLMLEPVRNQFIVELADRFAVQNWEVVYLAANGWRGKEIEETGINAEIAVQKVDYMNKLKKAQDYAEEEGRRALVISETEFHHQMDKSNALIIPCSVITTSPVACPHCGQLCYARAEKSNLYAACERGHQRWWKRLTKPVCSKRGHARGRLSNAMKGSDLKRRSRKPWTADDAQLLTQLLSQGMTYREVGKRLKRTRQSVIFFVRSGGIEGKRKRQACRAYLDQFDL